MLRAANDYEIKKRRFSDRYFVEYTCPHCTKPLTSQEDELGQKDLCPECGNEFAVSPTAVTEIADRRQQEEFKRQQKERDAKRRKKKKEAEARERQIETEKDSEALDENEQSEEQETAAEQKPNDPDSWKSRYPNLSKYLAMLNDANRIGIVFFGVLWLVLPYFAAHATGIGLALLGFTQAFVLLLAWISGFAFLYILYLIQMAVIEFVHVFCSTEEETVRTRKELQNLNRTMRSLKQGHGDDELD